MYELLNGGEKVEPSPRHVCPFAIVAFSYGKTAITLELKEKRSASLLASGCVGHWFYSVTAKVCALHHGDTGQELHLSFTSNIKWGKKSYLSEVTQSF